MREPLATGEARGRTYPRTVYGDVPGAGLAPVYGLGPSRFLADNDQRTSSC